MIKTYYKVVKQKQQKLFISRSLKRFIHNSTIFKCHCVFQS
jgi:hypothetical protein